MPSTSSLLSHAAAPAIYFSRCTDLRRYLPPGAPAELSVVAVVESRERQMESQAEKATKPGKPGTVKRVVYGDEEGRHRVEKVAVPETRHPDTLRYVDRKMCEKGMNRMERRPVDGLTIKCGPHKSGHGGKFTWEGPDDVVQTQLDPAPAAIDEGDPNFDNDVQGQQLEEGGQDEGPN